MPNLFISYDLIKPEKNYPNIEKAIKELGVASRVLLSVWYVKTTKDMAGALEHVQKAADQNDKLLVIDAANARVNNAANTGAWKVVVDNWNR